MLPAALAQYKQLYLQTAWSYLRTLESNLFVLKADLTNTAAVEESHLSAHSLKSQSLVMGFEGLGHLCHDLEIFFKDIKDGKRPLTVEDITTLAEATQEMKKTLAEISAHDTELEMQAMQNKVAALLSRPE